MTARAIEIEQELRKQLAVLPVEQKKQVLDFTVALAAKRRNELELGYGEAAADAEQEAEALEWSEGLIADVNAQTR